MRVRNITFGIEGNRGAYLKSLSTEFCIHNMKGSGEMRIIFTGGGTAGHINPAISVADALCRVCKKRGEESAEVLFVGTERGMENKLVPEAGYPLWHIDVSGLERSLSLKNIGVAFKTIGALRDASALLERFQPDAVFGTGGYVCYPILRQAAKKKDKIFTALHEANASAGLAVKLLSDSVDKVYLNFEAAIGDLKAPERSKVVGNPVRGDILRIDRDRARELLGIGNPIPEREMDFGSGRSFGKGAPIGSFRHVILSFGGSLGAQTLNGEMLKLMDSYAREHPDTLHIHACGKNGYSEVRRAAEKNGVSGLKNVIISEFIYDMPLWMAAADIVICRSGATTVSELAAAHRASVLIPSPNVTGDHQLKNATLLGDAGAAFVLRERPEELCRIKDMVATVLSDRRLRENMEICAGKLAPETDAAETIANDIIASVHRMKSNQTV